MRLADGRQNQSGFRLLISGTGGQGVLTAARLLCDCFVAHGHRVVSGQLHGMSQRGGSVQSSVMVDCGISPVIASGRADLVLGFEPVEAVRALPLMSASTLVYMNTAPVIPFVLGQRFVLNESGSGYPSSERLHESLKAVTPNVFAFDASRLAVEAGSGKAVNMVMLGCAFGTGRMPCTADGFWDVAVRKIPPALTRTNKTAFFRGVEVGEAFHISAGKP